MDPRFLAESVLTVRRNELSLLILWMNFFITMMKCCADAAIDFPRHLYYTMFMGQVAPKEINHFPYEYPKTQAERDKFSFDGYRDAVKGLPKRNFPPFHSRNVRGFTQHMLMCPETVRPKDSGKVSKKNDKVNDCDGNEQRKHYCRFCKRKHATGKHKDAGTRRYNEDKKSNGEKTSEKDERKRGD